MKVKFFAVVAVSILVSSCGSSKKRANKNGTSKYEMSVSVNERAKEEVPSSDIEPSEPLTPKASGSTSNSQDIKQNYIERYSNIAMEEMRVYKIPASITLAQGVLESSSGQSELTKRSNNHFGIKCHKGWTGKRTYHDDDEKGECFRVYKKPESSFRDHSLFLAERTRYQDLFKLKITDYKGWAKGLKNAGYATDKKYPDKLINIIETYKLYEYDNQVLGKKVSKKEKIKYEEPKHHIVVTGDTLYSLSKQYNISIDELKSINGLDDNTISIDQKIYLEK